MGKTRRRRDEYAEWIQPSMPRNEPPPRRAREASPPQQPVVPSDADITLDCIGCGTSFVFSVGEQQFYAQKGFMKPKRCKTCQARKREANAAQA